MEKQNNRQRNRSRLEGRSDRPCRVGLGPPSRSVFGGASPTLLFCFMLVPLHLVTSLVGVACAGSVSESTAELAESISVIPIDPNSPQQRQLWSAEISAAERRADETSKNELSRMIEMIRSVTFEPNKKVDEPTDMFAKVRPAEPYEPPVDTTADAKEEEKQKPMAPKPRLPFEPISEQTLQVLRAMSKNPENVDDPFELGETLFLSGNLQEAAVFYIEALNRTEPNDVDPAGNRAWILFQAGNSLRNSDMQTAMKMYTLLLTEYPDSIWAQVGQAQVQFLDWYLKNEPRKLVAEKEQTGGK